MSSLRFPIISLLTGSKLKSLQTILLTRCLRTKLHKQLLSTSVIDFHESRDLTDHSEESLKVKTVGLTKGEQENLSGLHPDQPVQPRSLKVAVIGSPNAGKSTLVNRILGWRVSAVSKKVHTTRKRTLGILTDANTQIVFLDTPGMITPEKKVRHRLEMSLLADPHASLIDADLIAVMVDASNFYTSSSLDPEVLKALCLHRNKKSILILNKVDLIERKINLLNMTRLLTENRVAGTSASTTTKQPRSLQEILELAEPLKGKTLNPDVSNDNSNTVMDTREMSTEGDCDGDNDDHLGGGINVRTPHAGRTGRHKFTSLKNSALWDEYYKKMKEQSEGMESKRGWENFQHVFMVSALHNHGVHDVREFLLNSAYEQDWMYHSSLVTDQDPVEMARHCVHEKLLDHLPGAIPYQTQVKVVGWEVDESECLRIAVDLVCSQGNHMGFLLRNKGELVQQIAAEAKQELMNTFKHDLSLKVTVKR